MNLSELQRQLVHHTEEWSEEDLQRCIFSLVAAHCRHFLENITRFKRDTNGSYPWAYNGQSINIKVLYPDVLPYWQECLDDWELVYNGKTLGTLSSYIPYAYPQNFLILDLVEEMQYRPEVITRFAQYAGMNVKGYDLSILTVVRPNTDIPDSNNRFL